MAQLALEELRLAERPGEHICALEEREALVGQRVEVEPDGLFG